MICLDYEFLLGTASRFLGPHLLCDRKQRRPELGVRVAASILNLARLSHAIKDAASSAEAAGLVEQVTPPKLNLKGVFHPRYAGILKPFVFETPYSEIGHPSAGRMHKPNLLFKFRIGTKRAPRLNHKRVFVLNTGSRNTESRKATGRPMDLLQTFVSDLRYGFRQFRRAPGFTAVAILSLALGIGANTTVFTAIDALMLKPLPAHDPGRLVSFRTWINLGRFPGFWYAGLPSFTVFEEMRKRMEKNSRSWPAV